MCRLYVTSSASTRDQPGRTTFTARWSASASRPESDRPRLRAAAGYAPRQNGSERPTAFSQQRAGEIGAEALIVEPVTALVQRREDGGGEVRLVVSHREAHVVRAGGERE